MLLKLKSSPEYKKIKTLLVVTSMKSKKELVLASNKSILSDFLGKSDLKVNLE